LLGVDNGKDTGDRLAEVVAVRDRRISSRGLVKDFFSFRDSKSSEVGCSHLVQLGAGRSDLLDAKLTELALELSELLRQIILVLAPERTSLDLARRLQHLSAIRSSQISPCVCVCGDVGVMANSKVYSRSGVGCVCVWSVE
jgi:hypothetical protein